MRVFLALLTIIFGLACVGLYMSAFIVGQTNQALVLQFGENKRVVTEPGLHWKIPIAQTVEYFDKRILALDTQPLEVNVRGKKRLVVDAFARFRIVNPLKFYQSVRDERIARQRLGSFLESSMRRALGTAELQDVVRDNRTGLMANIAKRVNAQAESLGVEIVDVRIKRADLPEANANAIYERMNTERKQEAAEFRATGRATANRVRAEADKRATVIRAEAQKDAEIMRGDGEAEQNRIFAESFGKDPGFFEFYRSMQAYEKSLASGDTRLLLSPDSEFFKYFGSSSGRSSSAP